MSMRSETLSLTITGDGKQLGAELGRQEGRVKSFGSRVGSIMAGAGKRIRGAVGKLANPMALIGGTAGVIMAARDLAEYQDKLSTLGISAGLSAEQMMGFEKRIMSAAYATGQGRDALTDAAAQMASIADADFAAEALEAVGKAATATSMDVGTVGQAFATFKRDMGATTEEAAQLFNTMAALGNTQSMDRFAKSAQVLGLSKENFAGYNAAIKSLAPTMGGLDQAANAVDQIAIALKTNKSGELRYMFQGVIDKDGTVQDYGKLLQTMAGMSDSARKKVFSKVGASMTGFDAAKVSSDFDTYMQKAKNASHVSDAFARKQGEAKFQMSLLTTAAKDFAGAALGPILRDVTASMSAMTGNPEKLEAFRAQLSQAAEVAGALGNVVGWVGKALGAWGDAWEALGNFTNDPLGTKKRASAKVDKIDPKLYGALTYKYGYNEKTLAAKSKQYMNKDGTVNARRLDALTRENRESHEAKRAAAEVQNKIAVNVNIAPDGRVITEVEGQNTSATATANRGKF